MGNRGHIANQIDFQTNCLKRANGCFPARSGALHTYFDLPHPLIHSLLGRGFRCYLSRKGCALPGPLKPMRARTSPADHIANGIRDGDDRIVESGLDVRYPLSDILPPGSPLSACLSPATCHGHPPTFSLSSWPRLCASVL